ncbi:MAG: hypothetical protein Q8929_01140, partial [Bacillota bacterium]|nr:hypothetical protein [Bacillota bacterium]
QYRVNLRKLSRDLEGLGYTLPGFLKQEDLSNLQNKCFEEKEMTNEGAEHRISREEKKETSKSNNAFFDGEETSHSDGKKQSFESLENDLSKDKKMISRREKNIGCNTEITTENTNKEYTQRTRARAREDSKFFGFSKKDQIESVSQAMVKLWQKHIRNEDLHPTKKRSHLLEAALQLYFKNDLKKWEVFCLRIKSSAFLMGEGPRKWYATLDWILEENNLIKVLEGNFDNRGIEGNRVWEKQEEELNLEKNQQKESVISSIKDSIWRDWCSQLAKGVPLHKDRIFHEPLSLFELTEIANARFIECEEDRLIWIGSSDQTVLNAIERGRFKINWVFENQYPKARTIRTRLEPLSPSQNSVSPQQNPGPFRVEQPSTLTRGQTHA